MQVYLSYQNKAKQTKNKRIAKKCRKKAEAFLVDNFEAIYKEMCNIIKKFFKWFRNAIAKIIESCFNNCDIYVGG